MAADDSHFFDLHDSELVAAMPAMFRLLAKSIPAQTLLALSERFGGTTTYIPKRGREKSPLASVLDAGSFSALSATFGGENVAIPTARSIRCVIRNREILELLASGWSTRNVALKVGMSQREIFRIAQLARRR